MSIKANCTQQILVSALIGLITGAGFGMLFAPDRGREIRQKILSTAGNIAKRSRSDFPDTEMEMDAVNGDLFSRQGRIK